MAAEDWLEFEDWNEYLIDSILPNGNTVWIDKSGKHWRRRDMTEQHLKNLHAWLERKVRLRDPEYASAWQALIERELQRRKGNI